MRVAFMKRHPTVADFYLWVITFLVPVLGKRVRAQPPSSIVMGDETIHMHLNIVEAIPVYLVKIRMI